VILVSHPGSRLRSAETGSALLTKNFGSRPISTREHTHGVFESRDFLQEGRVGWLQMEEGGGWGWGMGDGGWETDAPRGRIDNKGKKISGL